MSTSNRGLAAVLYAIALLALSTVVVTDARAQEQAVDLAAVQRLKQMSEFLDGLKQFSVQTQNINRGSNMFRNIGSNKRPRSERDGEAAGQAARRASRAN